LNNDLDCLDLVYRPLDVFSGVIEGFGYAIRNVNFVTMDTDYNQALILWNQGLINNLTVLDSYVRYEYGAADEERKIGGITIRNSGIISNCTVQNKYVNQWGIYVRNSKVGGITVVNDGLILGCFVYVFIETYSEASGICWNNTERGVIDSCTKSYILVVGNYNYETGVRGIVFDNQGSVTNCINTDEVYSYYERKYV
jgi:hypothetical protein